MSDDRLTDDELDPLCDVVAGIVPFVLKEDGPLLRRLIEDWRRLQQEVVDGDEWQRMLQDDTELVSHLYQYAVTQLDQWDVWQLDTPDGPVYIEIRRTPGDAPRYEQVPANALDRLRARIDADPAARARVDELRTQMEAELEDDDEFLGLTEEEIRRIQIDAEDYQDIYGEVIPHQDYSDMVDERGIIRRLAADVLTLLKAMGVEVEDARDQ
jgi:hypothetical protein